jgi:hypothetical protein
MTKVEILTMMDGALDKAVKIQGTEHDRKRKVKDAAIKKMLKMLKDEKDVAEIARKMGLSIRDVRYHVDPEWRKAYLAKLSGKHTGKDHITVANRIAYKRQLVAAGKVTA